MFIIKDDYDSDDDDNLDDNRSIVVDDTNLNYYDSDNYTTITEDLHNNSDSDLSIDNGDNHSTVSEPFLNSHHRKLTYSQSMPNTNEESLSDRLGFGKKSLSNGHPSMPSIDERKTQNITGKRGFKDGNESDGTGSG